MEGLIQSYMHILRPLLHRCVKLDFAMIQDSISKTVAPWKAELLPVIVTFKEWPPAIQRWIDELLASHPIPGVPVLSSVDEAVVRRRLQELSNYVSPNAKIEDA